MLRRREDKVGPKAVISVAKPMTGWRGEIETEEEKKIGKVLHV
jgi:hypothetical protein